MKNTPYLLIAMAGLALGGCTTSTNSNDLQSIRAMGPVQGGTPFTQALASEYRDRAIYENDVENEGNDAGWYARKGLLAAKGEVVQPSEVFAGGESLNRWGELGPVIVVRGSFATELSAARMRLMTFLDGGGRARLPVIAARAQGFFDCWLEEAWEPDDVTQCRNGFLKTESQFVTAGASPSTAATGSSTTAARIANTYQVFFDFDRWNIDAGTAQIIDKAATAAKQGKSTRIELTGHTDSSGSTAYNQGLSERRATAVKEQLVKDGVPAASITTLGVGKAGQLVPTADGIREPQNRRTEIQIR
jgi:OOP family OmpA-OmpF porin